MVDNHHHRTFLREHAKRCHDGGQRLTERLELMHGNLDLLVHVPLSTVMEAYCEKPQRHLPVKERSMSAIVRLDKVLQYHMLNALRAKESNDLLLVRIKSRPLAKVRIRAELRLAPLLVRLLI